MEPSAKEYRKGLSKKESFLISSLAREDKLIFTIEDTGRGKWGDSYTRFLSWPRLWKTLKRASDF
jgi:hypothetical protein